MKRSGSGGQGKERLRTIYGRTVTNGQCRAWFAKLSAFDAIRQEEDIADLVGEWEQAEKVCSPGRANGAVARQTHLPS